MGRCLRQPAPEWGSPASIPDYALQVQAPLTFSTLDSMGWAFRCSGDHPNYWSLLDSHSPSYTFNNRRFTVPENAVSKQGNSGKFDATFANWRFKKVTATLTLARSTQPPP